jgi:hypothetical protein
LARRDSGGLTPRRSPVEIIHFPTVHLQTHMPDQPLIDSEQLARWRLILGKDAQQCLGGM